MPHAITGGHRGLIESTIFADRFGARVMDLAVFGEEHQDRLRRYRDYWRLYKGIHWDYDRGGGGDPDSDAFVTMNFARRLVDVHANFLTKKSWEISIPDDPETPESETKDRGFIKDRLDKTWKHAEKETFTLELAQVGGIAGDAFARVFWREDDPLAPPHAHPEILPSQFVFPEYGGDDGTDRKRMRRCTIALPRFEDHPRLTFRGRVVEKQLVMWSEVWTKDSREIWRENELIETLPNPFGEIPVVHVPNYPIAGEPYGMSDLQIVANLIKAINETATDIRDVINYFGSPTTILKGARISELEMGAGRVWSIPKDADVENLELSGDLGASREFLALLIDITMDLSGTTKGALGGLDKMTGTTGAALAMAFMPLLELRAVKERVYGRGVRHINRLMLKAEQLRGTAQFRERFLALPKDSRYFTDITWGVALPRDESLATDTSIKKIDAGLSTKKREIMATGKTATEAEQIIQEWLDEKKQAMEAAMALQPDFTDDNGEQGDDGRGNPNPKRPNPDAQGAAVSNNASSGRRKPPGEGDNDD